MWEKLVRRCWGREHVARSHGWFRLHGSLPITPASCVASALFSTHGVSLCAQRLNERGHGTWQRDAAQGDDRILVVERWCVYYVQVSMSPRCMVACEHCSCG